MSWSFNATGNTRADALREFDNKLIENQVHIPDQVRGALSDAAKNLAESVGSTGSEITLTTSGHIGRDYSGNLDGQGDMRVAISYVPAKEEVPNVPKRTTMDETTGEAAQRDANDEQAARAQAAADTAGGDSDNGVEPRV